MNCGYINDNESTQQLTDPQTEIPDIFVPMRCQCPQQQMSEKRLSNVFPSVKDYVYLIILKIVSLSFQNSWDQ